ncbi:MAG: hypothetical protein UFA98_02165 [Ruminococcus sp.]|nr:hypothetical protein [Ruminococcus sp.]
MKKITVAVLLSLSLLVFFVPACAAEEIGGQEIISQQEDFVPQFTVNPDPSLKNHSSLFELDSKGYALFYTQTTVLALIAGYLILFKVRCIPKHERLHRRKQ